MLEHGSVMFRCTAPRGGFRLQSAAARLLHLTRFAILLVLAILPASPAIFGETDFIIPPGRASTPLVITRGPDRKLWFTEFTGFKIGTINVDGVVTEFPIPGAQGLCGITTGPDGNLWFTDQYAGFIGHISTSGSNLIIYMLPGGHPQGIVTGPDGNLWFVDSAIDPQNPANGFRVGSIDLAGNITEYPTGINPGFFDGLDYAPGQITAGPDGNLWFTNSVAGASGINFVGRITTAGVVTTFTTGDTPEGIASASDGNLWATEYGHVAKITTSGTETEYQLTGGGYSGITQGPDGNIWFTEDARLAFVTLAGQVTELPASDFSNFYFLPSIVTGPDEALWFLGMVSSNVGRINVQGQVTNTYALTLGSLPSNDTLGPDGNIWVAQYFANFVSRVTPSGQITSFPTAPGSIPSFIVAAPDGNLWFTEIGTSRIGVISTSGVILAEYQANGLLWSLTVGPDGNIWFPERRINGPTTDAIARLTLSGVLTEFSQGLTQGAGAFYITPGADGNLWFTEFAGGRLGRIVPSTGAIAEFPDPGSIGPAAIVTGSDNNLWVMDDNPSSVIRKFSTSGTLLAEYPAQFQTLLDIKPGTDGALWFPQYFPNGVGRIDTSGNVSYVQLTAVNAEGNDVAFGADHKLWVAEVTAGALARLSAIGGTGLNITATAGIPFNGAVANFVDGTPNDSPGQFTSTINWGDGSQPSSGTVSGPEGGPFTVSGTHTYTSQQTYTLNVTLNDTLDNASYPASPGSAQVGAQTTTSLSSSQNPSQLGQPVTFTATVTSSSGGSPTGLVTFTSGTTVICSLVPLVPASNGSTAPCMIATLAIGSHSIVAQYSGDSNFAPSQSQPLNQLVNQSGGGDFQILPITPGSLTLTQSYSNVTDPFFSQTVQVTVQAVNGYSGTVTLACSISPPLVGGSCIVNPPASGLVDANLTTTLTITAGAGTPIGQYMVIVSGQDNNGLMHQANQQLMVINNAPGVNEPPGGGGSTMVYFPGTQGTPIGNFMCPLVTGTGLSGSQPIGAIGGVCTFTPSSGTIPGPIMLTISGCQVARLHTHMPIYAAFFFGLPGVVLLSPLTVGKGRRKRLLQVIGVFLVTCATLWAVGCGGYGQLTPTGNYQVLVQGTGTDGTVYSAVVPVTVTPLH